MSEQGQFDPDRERGPIAWMVKNPVASNLLMLIFLVGGNGCGKSTSLRLMTGLINCRR